MQNYLKTYSPNDTLWQPSSEAFPTIALAMIGDCQRWCGRWLAVRQALDFLAWQARGVRCDIPDRFALVDRRWRCRYRYRTVAQLEDADSLRQATGLFLQRLRSGSSLLHQGGVLLSDFIHLRDGPIDFFDAAALLAAGSRNFTNDIGHTLHTGHHLIHGGTGFGHQLAAVIDLGHRVVDQHLDFLGGRCRTLCQAAYFSRDHGKTTTLFASAGSFYRGIQCQDIGLEGNPIDHADDVDNFFRRGIDGIHGI